MASYPTRRNRRRRSAGEGSVYQGADGRWRGAMTWTEPDGTRHRRVVRGLTAEAVRTRLDELRAKLRTGSLEPAGAGTVGEFLGGWVERERQRIRPSTWRQREQYVRSYLIPALGRRPLNKLTPADVEHMTAGLIESGRSPRTASHARIILRRALADAQRDGLVQVATWPPWLVHRASRARTIEPGRDYLDGAQLRRLLAVATEYRIGALVTVAATTGMRQGELLGLSWDDVDWQAGTLTVRRALARAWGGGMELAAPKTGRSRRTLHLPALAVEGLHREQREQESARLAVGTAWQDRDRLIFTDAIGRPLYRTAVYRAFRELCSPRQDCPSSRSTACATAPRPPCCPRECRCGSYLMRSAMLGSRSPPTTTPTSSATCAARPRTRWTGRWAMARRLRVRQTTGPNDKPAEGEAIWRLERIPRSRTVERYPGAGLPRPAIRRATGNLSASEPRPTDLVLIRHQYRMVLTASDGRQEPRSGLS